MRPAFEWFVSLCIYINGYVPTSMNVCVWWWRKHYLCSCCCRMERWPWQSYYTCSFFATGMSGYANALSCRLIDVWTNPVSFRSGSQRNIWRGGYEQQEQNRQEATNIATRVLIGWTDFQIYNVITLLTGWQFENITHLVGCDSFGLWFRIWLIRWSNGRWRCLQLQSTGFILHSEQEGWLTSFGSCGLSI